jgi:hypothetical protein
VINKHKERNREIELDGDIKRDKEKEIKREKR